uniref:Uncharacterized protein n=1 Tax=Engystomops pustulosus TaxID=76066 RepID=A0AAV6YEF9_ENGPU|nr:hypothetical protein GDO81_027449 [Engystomops pustulosus]
MNNNNLLLLPLSVTIIYHMGFVRICSLSTVSFPYRCWMMLQLFIPALSLSYPCAQTQTRLEHARIRELEQNLLFEKAKTAKLLKELEDKRVQ